MAEYIDRALALSVCPNSARKELEALPYIELEDSVDICIYDEVEEHPNCTVQILRNSVTGKESIGWIENT